MKRHRDEPEPTATPEPAVPPPAAGTVSAEASEGLSPSGVPASPSSLMALQRTAGNAAVLRLMSGREPEPLRNEPPASTPTSATSPLDVELPIEEEEVEAESEAAPGASAAGPAAEVSPPAVETEQAEAEGETTGNWPFRWPFGGGGPQAQTGGGSGSGGTGPALPPAGAAPAVVFAALRAAAGTKKTDAAWTAYVAGAFAAGSDDARLVRNLLLFGPEASWPAPTAGALIPFDIAPLSAPGERIIFNLTWTPSAGVEFHEIVLTASDGKFVSGGAKTKTVQGLSSGNLDFLIPAAWTGTALTVKAEVRPRGAANVLTSQTWTFGKKARFPTTMTQKEGEGEVALGAIYEYSIGPAVAGKTAPFYHHQTILETFPGGDCNITPADLTDAFKAANPGLTDSKKINEHFFGGSGSNGTFAVSNNDKIWDQHGGILSRKPDIEPHLKAWKEIHNDLFQVYEAEPGKPLGKYTVRRIIKADGSLALRKFKTP